jgi:hypothetical protein
MFPLMTAGHGWFVYGRKRISEREVDPQADD